MNFLKTWFEAFLRSRHTSRLFGRHALLESVAGGGRGPFHHVPEQQSRDLLRAARDDIPTLLGRLDSHEEGLDEADAAERLARVGPNEVDHEKPLPWWLHLWHLNTKNVFYFYI